MTKDGTQLPAGACMPRFDKGPICETCMWASGRTDTVKLQGSDDEYQVGPVRGCLIGRAPTQGMCERYERSDVK